MTRTSAPSLVPLIRAVYELPQGGAGHCLHIVLDDHNLGDDSVRFCIDRAREQSCETCLRCAEALLGASRTARKKAISMYRGWCLERVHDYDAVQRDMKGGEDLGLTFRPVWPPTEEEMAEFLFGLPSRSEWPLTYRRGRHAWVPLTALCWLVTWDATSHPMRGAWRVEKPGGERFDDDWEVIWGLRDDNVFPGEIERAFNPGRACDE